MGRVKVKRGLIRAVKCGCVGKRKRKEGERGLISDPGKDADILGHGAIGITVTLYGRSTMRKWSRQK